MLFSVIFTGSPGAILAIILLWTNNYTLDHKIEGTVFTVICWLGLSLSTRNRAVHSIHTLSNVVGAVKEDDFSFRARYTVPGDALGDLAIEINRLAQALEVQRLGTMEAENLLRKVMDEVEIVIFALSPDNRVRLLNRAAARFLSIEAEQVLNRSAEELGIRSLVEGPASETISRTSENMEKLWIARRASFRQRGVQHRLILLSEASAALRAQERNAWQRIIRVLGHEINNSLAPIKSITRTLTRMSASISAPEEIRANFKHGLEVVGSRADSLNRFLQSYARLAKLPPPRVRTVALRALIAHVVSLEGRLPVAVLPGPDVQLRVDPDQLEQVLINLMRNAVEAVLMKPDSDVQQPYAVTVSWNTRSRDLQLWIRDQGIGLPNPENLFVPFYTTKSNGSGIGLLLSRQIIEAHGGSLNIQNRKDIPGAEVEVSLNSCVIP
ncbi:MAG: periplasmic sensor signal transduction histidine kinase [Candidatus Angelobacter sp.]|nr:periplasmic sensor signal transduction histidine kinase [Candidatus Angelobacter sp.]